MIIIKRPPDVRSSEITSQTVYLHRREILAGGAAAAAGLAVTLAGCKSHARSLPELPSRFNYLVRARTSVVSRESS